MGKGLSYLKNGGVWVNYCWNHEPLNLLLHSTEYRLDQLNNKHTKTTANLITQFFEKAAIKKRSGKSLKFFELSTRKWRPCKTFTKLNGNHLLMVNIFKLHKYQTFALLKMLFMWAKCDMPIIKSVLKKFGLRLKGCQKCYFLIFAIFIFSYFKWLFSKTLWISKVLWSSSTSQNLFDLQMELNLQHWNDGPVKFFWNFHGNAFCFFIFSKRKKYYYNLTFHDTFKMYCCTSC